MTERPPPRRPPGRRRARGSEGQDFDPFDDVLDDLEWVTDDRHAERRAELRRWARLHHPDTGGDAVTYEAGVERIRRRWAAEDGYERDQVVAATEEEPQESEVATTPPVHDLDDPVPVRPAEAAEASPTPGRARGSVQPTIVPGAAPARRRRRVVVLALAAVAAVVAVGLVVTFLLPRDSQPAPEVAEPTATTVAPQDTTLVAIVGTDGTLVGGELLATDADGTSGLLVPGAVLVDIAGSGRVPFAQSLLTGDEAPGRAVADLLDVRVDGTWVLTAAGLAARVDEVGGLPLDVDVPVVVGDERVPAGPGQQLDGAQVVAWLDAVVDGEAAAARLARVDAVVTGLLATLGDGDAAVQDAVEGIGDAATSTLPAGELSGRLSAAADDVAAEQFGAVVLPTTEGAVVEDLVALRVDRDGADELLATRFAGAALGDSAGARVLVQNGDGTPGLGEQARDRLVDGGFRYVSGGNASVLGQDTTVVALPDDSPASRALGLEVAQSLGLGQENLAVGQDAPTLADLVVVLGADFAQVVTEGSEPSSTP